MDESLPISIPAWKVALNDGGLPPRLRAGFEREIITFLRACKQRQVIVKTTQICTHVIMHPPAPPAAARQESRAWAGAVRWTGSSHGR